MGLDEPPVSPGPGSGTEIPPPSLGRRILSYIPRLRRNRVAARVHPPNDHQYFGIGDRQDENVTTAN